MGVCVRGGHCSRDAGVVSTVAGRPVKHEGGRADLPGPCLTVRFAGGSEKEDPVSVCLLHSVLLAAVPAAQTPHPSAVCYSDPSR